MLTLKLARRNLVRHKRRTLIMASAIVFSYALMVIFLGMMSGGHAQMIEMGIRMGAGHVVVQGRGYQVEQTLDRMLADPAPVLRAVEEARGAVGVPVDVAPRLLTSGLVRAGDKAVGALIAGVDPHVEERANDLTSGEKRIEGGWLRTRDELPFQNVPSDLYLGATLAQTLDVKLGDRVAITVQPRNADDPRSAVFLVRGVFRTGSDDLDGFFVQVPLADAQELIGVGPGVTQIALLLPNAEHVGAMVDRLRTALADQPVEVLSWQEALPELHELIVLDKASGYLFMGIVFVLVALGIFNTILMSVIERTREFGLMMSLGVRGRRILAVVLAEAALLGALGLAFGLGLGLLGNHYLEVNGIDYGALAGGDYQAAGLNFAIVVYADLHLAPVIRSLLAVFAVVLLSGLWPAVRAARLKPVEALHHV